MASKSNQLQLFQKHVTNIRLIAHVVDVIRFVMLVAFVATGQSFVGIFLPLVIFIVVLSVAIPFPLAILQFFHNVISVMIFIGFSVVGFCFGLLFGILLPMTIITALCTNTNGRFFQKEAGDQFVNDFIGKLLQYVLDAESHKMTKERIMASNYYLMALLAKDIMANNSNRRPLDLVNFIARKHNEHWNGDGLRSLKLHTVTAQAGNVQNKNEQKFVVLVLSLTVTAIIVLTAVYWNSAFNSYPVPIREMNLYFAAICCICICLRLQPRQLCFSPLILWSYSVDIYLVIYLFAEVSIGFQVVGICFLVIEAVYLCGLLKMVTTPFCAHYVLPYIKEVKRLDFGLQGPFRAKTPEVMISDIEGVQSVMFDALDEVQAVLDSKLFDQYVGINGIIGIIAEYLKWTLPEFGDDDEQKDIEEVMNNLVRSRTVDEEQCDIESLSGDGGQSGSNTNITARLLQ